MDTDSFYNILVLGFNLGLLHALDADHIMAVSSLASSTSGKASKWTVRNLMLFCGRWAIGHGATLISLATLLIFARIELPPSVALYAEKAIGFLLISLGIYIIWTSWQQKIALQFHSHDDITHVHLAHTDKQYHTHKPVMVGIVHGLAGSAPILALIPATSNANPWIGLSYAALFSLGVLSAMMIFGLCLGKLQSWVIGWGQRVFQFSRFAIALISISFGSYWLFASS